MSDMSWTTEKRTIWSDGTGTASNVTPEIPLTPSPNISLLERRILREVDFTEQKVHQSEVDNVKSEIAHFSLLILTLKQNLKSWA